MGIPKQGKISYFFNPTFLNHVLDVLLDVEDRVHLPRGVQTINKQINTLKKVPVEHFLDIVSAEFNQVDETGKTASEGSGDSNPDRKDFNLEIINKFLQLVDIELLCFWTDTNVNEDEIYETQTIGNNVYKNARKLFKNVGLLDTKEENATSSKKDLMVYDKKPPRDIIFDGKSVQTIQNMSLDELLALVDQLFIYMSVLFCVGIFSKRGAWGLVQTNYLSDESKSYLKMWCRDVDYHYIDLGEIEDFEEAKSAVSLNLESALARSAGWLNVGGETESAERIVYKDLEDIKSKCKQLSAVNIKLLNEREELGVKNESLLTIINRLGEEVESFETKLTEKCEAEMILQNENLKLVEKHKESESQLKDIIAGLKREKTDLIESHKITIEGLNCRIELLKENSKTENDSAEKRIEELHKVYKDTIVELEGKIGKLKIETDTNNEQNLIEFESKLAKMATAIELKEKELKNKERAVKLKETEMKKRKQSLDQRNLILKSSIMKFNSDCRLWDQRFTLESQVQGELDDSAVPSLYLTNRSNFSNSAKSSEDGSLSSGNRSCDTETLDRVKIEMKSLFDSVRANMDKRHDDQVSSFYNKLNQLQRDTADIKNERENQLLKIKDRVFNFEKKVNLLESKIIELSDDNSSKNSFRSSRSSKSNTRKIRECFNVKQILDLYNNHSIDQIELKLIIKNHEELLYEDSMGKIYDFKEYDDFETINIVVPLKFVIDLMSCNDNVEDIKELYKEEMNKLLIRHRKLKDCCKVQRERCIKYNEMIKDQMKEDKKVLEWVNSLNSKVIHIREVIGRKVKDSSDENIMQRFEQFMKIFIPFPIEGLVHDTLTEMN